MIIEGGATNKSFVLDLLDQPEVIDASADTGWIDRVRGEGRLAAHRHSAVALAAAAIEAYEDEEEVSRQRLLATARGGRPQAQHDPGRPLDLKLRGASYRVRVARTGQKRFRVEVGADGAASPGTGHPADVEVERFDEHSGRITVNGRRFRLTSATHGPVHLVEVDGVAHRVSRDEGGVVRSPAPALVVATPLAVDDEVEADAPILVLESMKMETVLRAPFRARVRECLVSVGSQVEAGAPLLRLEPVGDAERRRTPHRPRPARRGDRPARGRPPPCPRPSGPSSAWPTCAACCSASTTTPLTPSARSPATWPPAPSCGGTPLAGEVELLTVFADMSELSRNQPGSDTEALPEGPVHSPREYFHSYLRSLDVERAGVPEAFQAKLARVFRYYGVTSLDRTPELEAAVFRIFLAQQRMAADAGIVAELLRQWLASAPPAEPLREPAGLALEHLIEATQLRFPSVSDLARGVVFRWFAQPLLRRNRARVYAAIRERPALPRPEPGRAGPRGADPGDGGQLRAAGPADRPAGRGGGADNAPLLEVLTRRYYGNHQLADVTARDIAAGDGTSSRFVTAEDASHGRVTLVAAAAADIADAARRRRRPRRAGRRGHRRTAWSPTSTSPGTAQPEPDAARGAPRRAARVGPCSCSGRAAARIARITVTVAGTSGVAMQHHFTFRPAAGARRRRGAWPRTG